MEYRKQQEQHEKQMDRDFVKMRIEADRVFLESKANYDNKRKEKRVQLQSKMFPSRYRLERDLAKF